MLPLPRLIKLKLPLHRAVTESLKTLKDSTLLKLMKKQGFAMLLHVQRHLVLSYEIYKASLLDF